MLTALQKKTAQAIINVFETSKVHGDYGKVTLMTGDAGELTFGRSQTTLKSGNLYLLIKAYCEASAALFKTQLEPYLPALAAMDSALNQDQNLHTLLKQGGDDPVMRTTQDAFFDRAYWNPALKRANDLGLGLPLSVAIFYDGKVQGALDTIIKLTQQRVDTPDAIGEQAWISEYVAVRNAWLLAGKDPLPRTVYRMQTFRDLINAGNWQLNLPLRAHGTLITAEHFEDAAELPETVIASAAEPAAAIRPVLQLTNPPLEDQPGFDVIETLQRSLRLLGHRLEANGTYDAQTVDAVKQFQLERRLKVDGVVGSQTYEELDRLLEARATSGWGAGRPTSGSGGGRATSGWGTGRPTSGSGGGRATSGWSGQTGRGTRF